MAIDPVKSVCAGPAHSVAITVEGALWSWGCNDEGQLGHGDETNRLLPTAVVSIAQLKVKQIAAGASCTLIIDNDGLIWTAGRLYPEDARSTTTFSHLRCCPETKVFTQKQNLFSVNIHKRKQTSK